MTPANKQTDEALAIIRKNGLPDLRRFEDLEHFHEIYKPDKFNVMLPRFINFTPGVKVAVNVIILDPVVDGYGNGKHYWSKEGKFTLRSVAVKIIASSAGINWILDKFGVIDSEYTPTVTRITFQAAAYMMHWNGKIKNGIGTYQYNSEHDMTNPRFFKKVKDSQGNKFKTDKPDIDQINKRRGVALQLAESGAMSRAVYTLLMDGLDHTFKGEDIVKPFLVPCAMDDIDVRDPIIRTLIAERSLGMTRDIYGPGLPRQIPCEVLPDKIPSEQPAKEEGKPTAEMPGEPSANDRRAIYLDQWEQTGFEERASEIVNLATKAKVDMARWTHPKTWTKEIQMTWIRKLAEKLEIIPKAEVRS